MRILSDVQEALRSEMKKSGLSYEDIAKATGKTRQSVWDKLNVRTIPSFAGLAVIAAAMNLQLDIHRKGGGLPDFDSDNLFGAAELTNISYSDFEKILDAMGLEIAFSTKA